MCLRVATGHEDAGLGVEDMGQMEPDSTHQPLATTRLVLRSGGQRIVHIYSSGRVDSGSIGKSFWQNCATKGERYCIARGVCKCVCVCVPVCIFAVTSALKSPIHMHLP